MKRGCHWSGGGSRGGDRGGGDADLSRSPDSPKHLCDSGVLVETQRDLVAGMTSPGWAAWIGEAYRSILATKHGGRAWLRENILTRGQFPSRPARLGVGAR